MKLSKWFTICFIAVCMWFAFWSGIYTGRLIVAYKEKSNTPIDTTARFLDEIREAGCKRVLIEEIENALREVGYKWVATKEIDDSVIIIGTQTKGGEQ